MCSRPLPAGSGDPAQTAELIECRILMRKRTHNSMKGEIPTKVLPSKIIENPLGAPCWSIRPRPSQRFFLLARRIVRKAAETCIVHCGLHAVVALPGGIGAGWLAEGPGRQGQGEGTELACVLRRRRRAVRDAWEIRGALVSDRRPFVALPQAWTGAG